MDKVYYMDGYHGGVYGHMPLGSVRDVLDTLKEHPDWKVNFEIEPVSYEFLKDRDPEAYEEITKLVKEGKQMEIVSGSYGQPYGWITDGESNIRHLVLGRKTLKKHFPDTDIESYVVQEPC